MTSLKGVGIPAKLLHEATGHVVTVEMKTGEVFRGDLFSCEDNWNCQIKNCTVSGRDGRVGHLEHVYIRGSKVRLIVVPDMLKNAPMFKRIDPKMKDKLGPMGLGGRGTAISQRLKEKAGGRGR
ncbi:unnamed protein product [Pedinophyceae sp. YPF-701]|nr:unnamed protein product [Pedinophyceae sp. YPF-701]